MQSRVYRAKMKLDLRRGSLILSIVVLFVVEQYSVLAGDPVLLSRNGVPTLSSTAIHVDNLGRASFGHRDPAFNVDVREQNGAAIFQARGTGASAAQYAELRLQSDQVVDKTWSISHRKDSENQLLFSYFDGVNVTTTPFSLDPGSPSNLIALLRNGSIRLNADAGDMRASSRLGKVIITAGYNRPVEIYGGNNAGDVLIAAGNSSDGEGASVILRAGDGISDGAVELQSADGSAKLKVAANGITALRVTEFTATNDLNIGASKLSAGKLAATAAVPGHVAYYGSGGELSGTSNFTYDSDGTLVVPQVVAVNQLSSLGPVMLGNATTDAIFIRGRLEFAGLTPFSNRTVINVALATAMRSIALPDASGTFAVQGDGIFTEISSDGRVTFNQTSITQTGVLAQLTTNGLIVNGTTHLGIPSAEVFVSGKLKFAQPDGHTAEVVVNTLTTSTKLHLPHANGTFVVQSADSFLSVGDNGSISFNQTEITQTGVLRNLSVHGVVGVNGSVFLGSGPTDTIVLNGALFQVGMQGQVVNVGIGSASGPFPASVTLPHVNGTIAVTASDDFLDINSNGDITFNQSQITSTGVLASAAISGDLQTAGNVQVGTHYNTNHLKVKAQVHLSGSENDGNFTRLKVVNPTAMNNLTIPDASGTFVIQASDAFLSISSSGDLTFDQNAITQTGILAQVNVSGPFLAQRSANFGTSSSDIVSIHGNLEFVGVNGTHRTKLSFDDPLSTCLIQVPDANGTIVVQSADAFLAVDTAGAISFNQEQITQTGVLNNATVDGLFVARGNIQLGDQKQDQLLIAASLALAHNNNSIVHLLTPTTASTTSVIQIPAANGTFVVQASDSFLSISNDGDITFNQQSITRSGALTADSVISLGGLEVRGDVTLGDANSDNVLLKGKLILEGATNDTKTTVLNPIDPTSMNTINVPDANGTIVVAAPDSFLSISTAGDLTFTQQSITETGNVTSPNVNITSKLEVRGDTKLGDSSSDRVEVRGEVVYDGSHTVVEVSSSNSSVEINANFGIFRSTTLLKSSGANRKEVIQLYNTRIKSSSVIMANIWRSCDSADIMVIAAEPYAAANGRAAITVRNLDETDCTSPYFVAFTVFNTLH